jgi:hypothetical protein
MDPVNARKTWRTLEPLHGMIYFVPEADEEYSALGITSNRMGYFASRSAAFGTVSAEVVIATFYNFNPALVRRAIPAAWSIASPADITAARLRAADRALRRGLGTEAAQSDNLAEAAAIASRAAQSACDRPHGRPLFAAHAALPWPGEPLLDLWHAQTLLREWRGDGHIAALLLADLDPVEALVMHEASGELPPGVLQATRAWPDEEWVAAIERLRQRGLLTADQPTLTSEGASVRQRIEDETDARALAPYAAIGEQACAVLRELVRPFSRAVVDGGLLRPDLTRATE